MVIDKKASTAAEPNPQIKVLLDRLDAQPREVKAGADADKQERHWPFRQPNLVISVDHPGGGTNRVNAHARTLWCDGISLLYAGFGYPKSPCSFYLNSPTGETHRLTGSLASCRHVEGSWHEVEIRFNQRIDPHLFIDRQRDGAADSLDAVDLPNLRGRVLYLDDSELDQRLLGHHIRGSGIELITVQKPADAIEKIRTAMIDIFLCDLNLGGNSSGVDAVREARAAEFMGPVVLLTAENSPAKLALGKTAGADHIFGKPYPRTALIQLMTKLHREVGAFTSGAVIYSSLDDQSEMSTLLEVYVEESKRVADKIQQAILANNFDAVRELCLNIKGSAVGYGFAPLGLVAEKAMRSLDSTMSLEESRPQLRMLMLTCCHLGLRRTAKPAEPMIR